MHITNIALKNIIKKVKDNLQNEREYLQTIHSRALHNNILVNKRPWSHKITVDYNESLFAMLEKRLDLPKILNVGLDLGG